MVTVQNDEEYFVHFFKDTNNNTAYLPATTIHGKKQPKGKYRIKCHDDKIEVIFNKNKQISLGKWLEKVK